VAAAPVWMEAEEPEAGVEPPLEPPVGVAAEEPEPLGEEPDEPDEPEADGEAEAEAGDEPEELPPDPPPAPAAQLQTALAAVTTAGALWTPQDFTTQVSARLEILTLLAELHWHLKSVSWQPAAPPADSRHG